MKWIIVLMIIALMILAVATVSCAHIGCFRPDTNYCPSIIWDSLPSTFV